jgi:hypothetical protein
LKLLSKSQFASRPARSLHAAVTLRLERSRSIVTGNLRHICGALSVSANLTEYCAFFKYPEVRICVLI